MEKFKCTLKTCIISAKLCSSAVYHKHILKMKNINMDAGV